MGTFGRDGGGASVWIPGPNGAAVTPADPAFCGKIDIVEKDDLQIYDFLHSKVMLAARPDMLPQKANGAPFDVLSFETKFIVTRGVTFNPSWKLVKIAIDPSGTLYNGQRIRTNDLTITLGAVTTGSDGKPAASQSLNEQHLANLIGRAVADAIQDQR